MNIIRSVPQGSILGPFFFLVCVNDIPDVCNSKNKLFTDLIVYVSLFSERYVILMIVKLFKMI